MNAITYWPAETFHLPWAEPVEPDHAPFYQRGHVGFPSSTVFVTRKLLRDLERNRETRELMIAELRRFMLVWSVRSPVLN